MKHWKRLRNWLILKLAGGIPVMINVKLSDTFYLPRGKALFHNVEIVYPRIAIADHDASRGEIIITHPEGTFVTLREEDSPAGYYVPFDDGFGVVGYFWRCECGGVIPFADQGDECKCGRATPDDIDPDDWYDAELMKPKEERAWSLLRKEEAE